MTTDTLMSRWRRLPRWLPAVTIPLLGGLLILGCWFWPWPDQGHRSMATTSAIALTGIVYAGWLIVLAPIGMSYRILVLVAVAALPAMFNIKGCTGDLLPEIAFRWEAKPDATLVAGVVTPAEPIPLVPDPATDSPQFLGSDRTGIVTGTRLGDWSDSPPRELWRQPIGAAFSSFAVVGDYAFTQEQRADLELVTCYELKTGKLVWSHNQHEEAFDETMGGRGPRSTPTIVDGRVYAMGARGKLDCLDATTGKPVWSRDVVEAAYLPQWAKSCSPLVVDGLCIVTGSGQDHRSLVAYDAKTGDERWAAGDDLSSYSSPMLATLDGVRQVVIVNADSVTGQNLADGRILWRFEWPGEMPKVAQPIVVDDARLYIGAGYGLGSKLLKFDVAAGEWSIEVVWENRTLKPKFTDPILYQGHVYGLDDGRVMTCIDVETGKVAWKGGRYGHGQLLLAGDTFIVQAETGEVVLVAATPDEHRELGTLAALTDKTWNIPTASGEILLVRNHVEAVAYALVAGGSDSPAARVGMFVPTVEP